MSRDKMKVFSVIIEKDEYGLYVTTVYLLHGCHTQAKSIGTLIKRINEAVEFCL